MRPGISYIKQFVKEEISRRPVRPVAEAPIGPEGHKGEEIKGSLDSVCKNIANLLGKPELAPSLTSALKKAKDSKGPVKFTDKDKVVLADALVNIMFKNPKTTMEIAKQLIKISSDTSD
jgi:hypothetical protein